MTQEDCADQDRPIRRIETELTADEKVQTRPIQPQPLPQGMSDYKPAQDKKHLHPVKTVMTKPYNLPQGWLQGALMQKVMGRHGECRNHSQGIHEQEALGPRSRFGI